MTTIAAFTAERLRGRDQLNLPGKRTTFTLSETTLVIQGIGNSRLEFPLSEIDHLRVGTVQVNPSGTVTMGGLRLAEARIQLNSIAKPLTVESSPGNESFQQFFSALASEMLRSGGKVERGRGYSVPCIFIAVFALAAIWQARALLEAIRDPSGLLQPALVTIALLAVLGALTIWTWKVYAPVRLHSVADLNLDRG